MTYVSRQSLYNPPISEAANKNRLKQLYLKAMAHIA